MGTVARFTQPTTRRAWFLGLAVCLIAGLILMGLRSTAKVSASQKGQPGARASIQVMLNGSESINLSSPGNLGVALLGGAAFDVKSVDPASLSFAGASVMKIKGSNVPASSASSSAARGKRTPAFNIAYKDVNKDGYADLVAYFPIHGLSQLNAGRQDAILRARTYSGAAITGSQTVQVSGDRQKNIPKGDGNCNGGTITINDNAAATPYPSMISVAGLKGVISNLTVSVFGFNHTFAQDVSVLLVGPTGQKMILFAQAGNDSGVEAVNLTFDDAASTYLPLDTAITSGTYKPTNHAGQDIFGDVNFFAPAPQSTPASPYYAMLSSFLGTNPNGTWSLYVVDNAEGDSGSIDGGWCLEISTAPSVTTCAATLLQGSFDKGDTTQTGRLFLDGTPSECVGAAKTCPGADGDAATDTLHYDTYTLPNQSGAPACVTVTTTSSCGADVFASAYLTSYTPPPPNTNLCMNYLGDAGLSPQGSNGVGQSFSVTVPAGATLVLVANEITSKDPLCEEYSLLIEGNICTTATGTCTLTCPANITKSNDPNQCGAVVTYNAPTTGGACGTITCSPASGSFFPKGTTTVTCSAPDASTRVPTATCSFTVTVNDTQPPTITCPANVTSVSPVPGTGGVVTYPPPTASDNCPGVTASCTPPSGSVFALGTTTVTCTASDTSGNTATCSFTVTEFDGRLQDDSLGCLNVVLFNTVTGDYRWCCNGTTFTGKAKVTRAGNVYTLFQGATDRRVQITLDAGAFSPHGSASLQVPVGVTRCTITDRDIRDDTCTCGAAPPPVGAPQK